MQYIFLSFSHYILPNMSDLYICPDLINNLYDTLMVEVHAMSITATFTELHSVSLILLLTYGKLTLTFWRREMS